MQDSESLVDLGVEGLLGLEEVQQLGVVHLEQHTSDLASELRLGAVKVENKRLATYTKNNNFRDTYATILM